MKRTTLSLFAAALASGLFSTQAFSVAAFREFDSRGMRLERELLAENLGHIWGMAFLPDGSMLMTIKSGKVRKFDVDSKTFVNISGVPQIADYGQGGLLDVAISPDFQADGRVYLSYAKATGGGNYTTALGFGTLVGSELRGFKEIFVAGAPSGAGEHFGGRLVIDLDFSIWLSVGERNDRTNAQRLDNHLGKILRLTSEGRAHPNNPFVNQAGAKPEIFSYGHRNPQGLAKNHLTNQIWESEHGPKGGDEINHIRKGQNYGWPRATYGTEYYGPAIGETEVEGMIGPMHYWKPSIAPSGMIVYSGDLIPAWKGLVLNGALALTHFNLTEIRDGKKVSEDRLFGDEGTRIREIEQGPDGSVYYSTDAGFLFRIRPAN